MQTSNKEAPARIWIVELSARAAFRFDADQIITIVASPQSTRTISGIRLRNSKSWVSEDHSEGAPTFVGAFVAEAAGVFSTKDEAVSVLANLANPHFQVMALITNAGAEESEDLVAYTPPINPTDKGGFVIQRHSQARAPAARLRKVAAKDAMEVFKRLMGHPQEDRLHRAMSHFRMALSQLDPFNRVLSAESLWMVVENLSHVVIDRLRAEHSLPQNAEGKHQLALKLGFKPKALEDRSRAVKLLIKLGLLSVNQLRRDNSHMTELDRHIRKDMLLGGDDVCYKQLKDMSDGYEHGYMGFGEVQKKSKVADQAFTHLRKALLKEIGLDSSSPLYDSRFDDPVGIWRPVLEAEGSYTDSSGRKVNLSGEKFNDPWPDAPGLSLVPLIKSVVDNPDGTRNVTLEINGSANALTAFQTAKIESTKWITPSGKDGKIINAQTTTRLNGEVVEDSISINPQA